MTNHSFLSGLESDTNLAYYNNMLPQRFKSQVFSEENSEISISVAHELKTDADPDSLHSSDATVDLIASNCNTVLPLIRLQYFSTFEKEIGYEGSSKVDYYNLGNQATGPTINIGNGHAMKESIDVSPTIAQLSESQSLFRAEIERSPVPHDFLNIPSTPPFSCTSMSPSISLDDISCDSSIVEFNYCPTDQNQLTTIHPVDHNADNCDFNSALVMDSRYVNQIRDRPPIDISDKMIEVEHVASNVEDCSTSCHSSSENLPCNAGKGNSQPDAITYRPTDSIDHSACPIDVVQFSFCEEEETSLSDVKPQSAAKESEYIDPNAGDSANVSDKWHQVVQEVSTIKCDQNCIAEACAIDAVCKPSCNVGDLGLSFKNLTIEEIPSEKHEEKTSSSFSFFKSSCSII